ncbi:MAG TPA: asparagine synthase (glutamine-hydrolyzing) [Vicinamibacteria bacterium]
MCGISAVLGAGGEARVLLSLLHAGIRHRGPDGEGVVLPEGAPVALAARRLKVKDLSDDAAQPMASPDGRVWLSFNGEIDNFRELRQELAALGRAFRSQGDTEVLLAAYETWGTDAFARLDGMWAAAIADLGRRRLVLSRDRFGIKPLYWALEGGVLLVGSEIRQILAARGRRPRAHAPLVAAHLRQERLPCLEETFFEGVQAVPPASWCAIPFDHDGPRPAPAFHRYWDLAAFRCADPERPALAYAEARQELECRLARAVDTQRVADVPVGSLLSGGLHTAELTALLAQLGEYPAFTVAQGNGTASSERGHARAVAERHQLVLHETGLDARWLASHAARAVAAIEEPPLSLAPLAQHRVFQLCRERGVTVVLDGQGADEVLGGYPYHQRTLLWDRLRSGRLSELAREGRAVARREGVSALRVCAAAVLPGLRRRLQAPPDWVDPEYGPRALDPDAPGPRGDAGRDPSRVNRQLFRDVRWGNVKIVLAYTDKNAMAHSVEARVPYFDRRVVELAFSLPDHYKVGGGERKRLLRDVARGRVPDSVVERRDRMGFALPETEVLRALWPSVRDLVRDRAFLSSPCFRRGAARRLIDRFEAGRDVAPAEVWRMAALALWQQAFAVALP